ncbi:uncharacterized protein LOC144544027 [Carex rostrata]
MNSSPEPASSDHQPDDTLTDLILMNTYTFLSAFMLFATFLIVVTRFRLWHRNKFLKIIPEIANHPVNSLINQSIGFLIAYQKQEKLYLIWVVILLIAQDNIYTISSYSLFEKASSRWVREFTFLYNFIFIEVLIIYYKADNKIYYPLLALMSLVLAKFLIRIISYAFAERAYGNENINLVAEYMKSEHKLTRPSDTIDPKSMKGYKYLVMGEKIKPKIKAPDYSPEVELTDDVVTVERVWSCKKGLLHPSVDTNGHIKDVCLSFALFKLLRRRDFGYLAAETEQTKTRQLIFDGLLAEEVDKERVFRVIKMELGFLRDLKFTRYPVGFAFGFPVLNLILLGGMIGVTLWLAIKVFSLNNTLILTVNNHNVDYPLTNLLLILLILMELFEWLTYVFCDWTRVVMICQNVKSNSSLDTNEGGSSDGNSHQAQPCLFGYKVLALFFKPRRSLSVKSTLGQYSLLTNCHKTCVPWHYVMSTIFPCHKLEVRPPGVKRGKIVPITTEVKKAIFDALVESRSNLTNGREALRRNGASDLEWTLNLSTEVHTILVWHIATSLCAIPLENFEESIKSNHEVATYLSNYCAYLVTFHPELLPVTSNWVKFMIWEIVKETSEFFGKQRDLKAKYEKSMSSGDNDQTIIHLGSKLGRYLMEKIPDDAQRWKLMAAFWSEFILYVAPTGSTAAHMEQLSNGSEFITHLWALLYHAGMIDTTYEEYHP